VVSIGWWKRGLSGLALAVLGVLKIYNVWDPTDEQLQALGVLVAALWFIGGPLIDQFILRPKVTPNATVDRKVTEALYTSVPTLNPPAPGTSPQPRV
jgi:hypothetical protein